MSMKNSSDTIRNRTSDLLACSTVPQPTAPPCAHFLAVGSRKMADALVDIYWNEDSALPFYAGLLGSEAALGVRGA
jgi:hypothetical protein